MITLSGTQIAQQLLDTRTPYIGLTFTSPDGGTTYDYSVTNGTTDRTLSIDHTEMPYTSGATIVLDNHDRAVPDLRGYWVQPDYGDVTGSGNEGEETARLWVKKQNESSAPGQLQVSLELEGMWEVLDEIEWKLAGDAPFYQYAYDTATPLTIMQACFTRAGMTLNCTVDDGIIDTVAVYFFVNGASTQGEFDSLKDVVYRALSLTKCYIRLLPDMVAEVVYPQEADAVDETYYTVSTTGYIPSYQYNERMTLLVPNKITVVANADAWDVTATAEDTAQQALYDPDGTGEINKTWVIAKITNSTDAGKIAAALLTREKAELLSAYGVTPHDARVQLYDKEQFIDTRGI